MANWISIIAILVVYVLLTRWRLPMRGIPTRRSQLAPSLDAILLATEPHP